MPTLRGCLLLRPTVPPLILYTQQTDPGFVTLQAERSLLGSRIVPAHQHLPLTLQAESRRSNASRR